GGRALPARPGALPADQSARGDPRGGGTRALPRWRTGTGAPGGQLDLRGRLSHDGRPGAPRRCGNDRGPRLRGRGATSGDGRRGGAIGSTRGGEAPWEKGS